MTRKKIEIIYDDANLLVINKPSGVSVTADRSGNPDVPTLLHEQLGRDQELRLVHRLDKDTSGVLIIARNLKTQSTLCRCFEKRELNKSYLAIVGGFVSERRGRISVSIDRSRKDPRLMCVVSRRGKTAITKYRLMADFGSAALLEVNPVTGRTHQIRVHLAHAGMGLSIDPLYGGSTKPIMLSDFKPGYRRKEADERPLIERLTLHCYSIELPQTEVCRASVFVAGLDKKFAATIKMLAKHNPHGEDAFVNKDDLAKILNGRALSAAVSLADE